MSMLTPLDRVGGYSDTKVKTTDLIAGERKRLLRKNEINQLIREIMATSFLWNNIEKALQEAYRRGYNDGITQERFDEE